MPRYTPMISFYICQLCCCRAPSLVEPEWSCLRDFSWPQIFFQPVEVNIIWRVFSAVNPPPNSHQSFVFMLLLWCKLFGSIRFAPSFIGFASFPFYVFTSCFMFKWDGERGTTPASAVLFSLSFRLFFPFHLSPTVPALWDDMSKCFCQASWVD